MNTLTIKAKSLLAANKLDQIGYLKVPVSMNEIANVIELTFSDPYPKGSVAPMFAMAPFSSVVGCSIYRIDDPGKIICLVPPQGPADLFAETFHSKSTASTIDHIKMQTERVAKLVLAALNDV